MLLILIYAAGKVVYELCFHQKAFLTKLDDVLFYFGFFSCSANILKFKNFSPLGVGAGGRNDPSLICTYE
jgi:hypothetical protein